MPAAAVIPAPIAYIIAAAVKKLVVGTQVSGGGFRRPPVYCPQAFLVGGRGCS